MSALNNNCMTIGDDLQSNVVLKQIDNSTSGIMYL